MMQAAREPVELPHKDAIEPSAARILHQPIESRTPDSRPGDCFVEVLPNHREVADLGTQPPPGERHERQHGDTEPYYRLTAFGRKFAVAMHLVA